MVLLEQEYGFDEVKNIAGQLVAIAESNSIFTFKGPIGVGKTTLIKSVLRQLGVTDPIVSPTFTYVSCYLTKDVRRVYHFDLYRIETIDQFEQMGFDEYIYEPEALIFIEWPSILANSLKKSVCVVLIDYAQNSEKRSISVTMFGRCQ
jgi:tRNA threonylcarbamoyladenosine biosynthesis protein TsaE